ncbi:MAG: hypothetical protein K2Q20_13025 [Phycisphaerales bacterium]|nr:hypothetical protein [Phycisphaerales bacterium]
MRSYIAVCVAALASLLALPAFGQVVLSSNTEANNSVFLSPGGTLVGIATPFTVGSTAFITGVELKLGTDGTPADAIVEIRSGATLPGTVIASGTVTVSTGALNTFTIPIAPNVSLFSGGAYWVSVRATGAGLNVRTSTTTSSGVLIGSTWTFGTVVNAPYFRVLGVVPTGACCNPVSTGCLVLTSSQCATFGGIYGGDTSVCSIPQCLPVGACCRGLSCSLTTQPGCSAVSPTLPPGRWLGPGAACPAPGQPSPCCPADINGSGTRDVSDIFSFLSTWFAGCP